MEENEEETALETSQILNEGEYEFEKYKRVLEENSYCIGKDKLFKVGKTTLSPISNFIVIIDEQINYNNGKDIITDYRVHGIIIADYKKLPQIRISKQELENFSFILNSKWKLDAIIMAGTNKKDMLREVTQLISKDEVINRDIYTHTGFQNIDGNLIYLYHNGYIGNRCEEIEVDLSADKLQQYSFTEKEFDLQEALMTSFSIIDLADVKITIPLLATTYLAPLTTILREEDISADYILWLEGSTGTRKSSITALLLSHFGKFSRNSFPCSFRDTLNSIEKKAFILKDSLNVIDDFNPETMGNKKLDIAEKMFGMYGDRAGRDRMSQDGKTLKSPYIARGLCVITGESFPNVAQSRLARAVIVNIKRDSIDLKLLSRLQNNREQLAYCMKKYIDWIIRNEMDIREYARRKMEEFQEKTQSNEIHGRTNEAVGVMQIGFCLFLGFFQDCGVIDELQSNEFEKLCYETLSLIAQKQTEEVDEQNPITMFVSAIEQLYLTNKIYLKDYNDWDKTEYSNSVYVGMVDNSLDEFGAYYFFPDIIYTQIVKFYREQGIKFPFSKSALWKYLDNEGYLYRTPKSQRRTVRRKMPDSEDDIVVIPVLQEKMKQIYLKPRYYND